MPTNPSALPERGTVPKRRWCPHRDAGIRFVMPPEIDDWRVENGIRMAEIADALGLTTGTLSKKWAGTRGWLPGQLEIVAGLLKLDVSEMEATDA